MRQKKRAGRVVYLVLGAMKRNKRASYEIYLFLETVGQNKRANHITIGQNSCATNAMYLFYQIVEGMRRNKRATQSCNIPCSWSVGQNKCATYVIYLIYFVREAMRQNKRATHNMPRSWNHEANKERHTCVLHFSLVGEVKQLLSSLIV